MKWNQNPSMIGNHAQMKNQPDQSCLLHATCPCTMSGCSLLMSCSLSTKALFALISYDDANAYRVEATASWWGLCALVQQSMTSWPSAWQFQPQYSSTKTSLISPFPNPLSQSTQSWYDASFTPQEKKAFFNLQALFLNHVASLVSPQSCSPFHSFLQILSISHKFSMCSN